MRIIARYLDYKTPWEWPDVYLFTGNSTITADGRLVMGRGAAKEVRDSYAKIDDVLGQEVSRHTRCNLAWVNITTHQRLGWFQVKTNWKHPASLELIERSAEQLSAVALYEPEARFHINCPGVGNGARGFVEVMNIIKALPDNVSVYYPDADLLNKRYAEEYTNV